MFSQSFCPVDQIEPTVSHVQQARPVGDARGRPGEVNAARRKSQYSSSLLKGLIPIRITLAA
jgi:hypothetical protein